MKTQRLTLYSGNKGAIFTLDMILATFILALTLMLAAYYAAQASENKLSQVQLVTTASDIIRVLDETGTIQTFNSATIQNATTVLLPAAYSLRLQINGTNHDLIDFGEEIPKGRFVASGKYYFYGKNDYGLVRYWIWLKE